MRQFTPARVNAMHDRIVALVDELIDARRDQSQLDVVDDFAYPMPVTVICELLGVPREDESRFHAWADTLAHSVDPDPGEETSLAGMQAAQALASYMRELIAPHRAEPGDHLLSGLAARRRRDRMDDANLVITMILLLIAGHETTVNLITNGTLTLLRYPAELERLREHPERIPIVVEEMLRYEPPVQFVTRFALADIAIAVRRSRKDPATA